MRIDAGLMSRWLPWLLTGALGIAWLLFVDQFAVDILFHDQWALYEPMFNEAGAAEAFVFQHGPHRQGLGGVVTYWLAGLSGFSVVAESSAIVVFLALASALALHLKRFATGVASAWDVCIPLLFLNPVQVETIVDVPNLSHSVLPLVLMLAIARCWLSSNVWIRVGCGSLLAAISLFTGFGLFVYASFVLLWLASAFRKNDGVGRERGKVAGAVGIALLGISAVVFAFGYEWQPSNSGMVFPHWPVTDYFVFIDHIYGRLFYFPKTARFVVGFLIVVALLICAYRIGRAVWTSQVESRFLETLLFQFSTSILFVWMAAIGRVSFGADAGSSSRYTTLAIPAIFAVYCWIAKKLKSNGGLRWAQYGFVLAAVVSFVSSAFHAYDRSGPIRQGKLDWLDAYEETGSVVEATDVSGFPIFPEPPLIEESVEYLERNRLGAFH